MYISGPYVMHTYVRSYHHYVRAICSSIYKTLYIIYISWMVFIFYYVVNDVISFINSLGNRKWYGCPGNCCMIRVAHVSYRSIHRKRKTRFSRKTEVGRKKVKGRGQNAGGVGGIRCHNLDRLPGDGKHKD